MILLKIGWDLYSHFSLVITFLGQYFRTCYLSENIKEFMRLIIANSGFLSARTFFKGFVFCTTFFQNQLPVLNFYVF